MSSPFGDMGSLLRQAQQMQRELDRVREELKKASVRGSAGGGAVVIELSGDRKVQRVKIEPEALKGADASLLEDLVQGALREALAKADQLNEKSMSRVTGGLQLPGMS